jgi:hypothetical protein
MNHRSHTGSGLVEVVVAASILSVIAIAFIGSFTVLARAHTKDMLTIKAELLAEEGLEALRLMKAAGWTTLSSIPTNTTRYLNVTSTAWSVATTPNSVDGAFWRSFKVYSVMRNGTDDIVSSGGTTDPNTLLTEVTVSWLYRDATSTVSYQTYVTNI